MAKVAFMTIGLLHEPWGSVRIQGFIDRIEPVFGTVDAGDGFIRRCLDVEGDAQPVWGRWTVPTIFQSEACANRVAATLSLWQNLESVFAFAYNGQHAEALTKRKEWFVHPDWP